MRGTTDLPADVTMTDTTVLLLTSELAVAVVLVWPSIPAALRNNGWLELCDEVAGLVGVSRDDVATPLRRMLSCGVLHKDGTVDRAVVRYLEGAALAKLAGIGANDPDRVALKYLMSMSLETRMDWLVDHNLLT